MSASSELIRLLEQWRQLTERETHSILLGDWQALSRHQAQKQRLTQDITAARTALAASGQPGKPSASSPENPVRSIVTELKAMEIRNRELLSAKHQNLRAELDRVSGTARDLHGLRRAYGTAASNRWHSYS
jgi:hypothetical protein